MLCLSPRSFTPMTNTIRSTVGILLLLLLCSPSHSYPKPSAYPISWELKFEYNHPKRIVVRTALNREPEAYWYMTFTVANLSREDHKFLPLFEMMADDGQVQRS